MFIFFLSVAYQHHVKSEKLLLISFFFEFSLICKLLFVVHEGHLTILLRLCNWNLNAPVLKNFTWHARGCPREGSFELIGA